MKRELYVPTPSVRNLTITAPVNKGGTGGTTSAEVAVSLGGVLTATIGQPNGPVKQEVGGGVSKDVLPASVPLGATMDGPQDFYVGSTNTLSITNYDAKTTYAVSASAGTISINGSTITFVAPSTAQAVTLTIGGRQVTANVISLAPYRPKITVPVYGATGQALSGLQIQGNALSLPTGTPSHMQSDWQLSTDPNFNTVVQQSLNDTVNKTTWTVNGLEGVTTYYVRVRYRDTNLGYSNWSNASKFSTMVSTDISVEEAKLLASDRASGDGFGTSVAINGDATRVVIGAFNVTVNSSSGSGAAYVFSRSGSTWTQEAKLTASDAGANYRFGAGVAISGDGARIIIGAYGSVVGAVSNAGAAYIFVRSGTNWTQEQKLVADAPTAGTLFGNKVDISSDGARCVSSSTGEAVSGTNNAGVVYIFTRSGTTWTKEAKVNATDYSSVVNMQLGVSVKLTPDGTRLIAGPQNGVSGSVASGAAYVFVRNTSTNAWSQEAKLVPASPVASSGFGQSVTISADGLRAACAETGLSGSTTGSANVFRRSGSTWTLEQRFTGSDAAVGDVYGYSMAFNSDGSVLFVGARFADPSSLSNAGAAYSHNRVNTTWTQSRKFTASDKGAGDNFGAALAMATDVNRAIIGANAATVSGVVVGSAYVYR